MKTRVETANKCWSYFFALYVLIDGFIPLIPGELQDIGSCNFEETDPVTGNNLCEYTHGPLENEDFFNWELESDGVEHYMNVKTEEHFAGQKARLYSVEIHHQDTHCYSFQYHMEGGNTGNVTEDVYNSLNVYVIDSQTHNLLLPVWESSPNEYGSGWTTVQLAVSPKVYQVVFEAEVLDTSPGIIALDNIEVSNEACDKAPHFLRVGNKEINKNQNVTLKCLLWGNNLKLSEDFRNQTPTIELQKSNGDSFSPISQPEIFNDHLGFIFGFSKVTKDTEGDYRCVSRNVTSVGVSNFAKISVKRPPVPQQPPEVRTLGSSYFKIHLNSDNYVGDDPIVQTILNYRPVYGTWADVHEIDGTDYHLWHLKPDTEYELTVTLVRPGPGGAGVPGPALIQKTNCGVPLRSVSMVKLQPTASSEIKVMWKAPDFSVTQCHFHSYVIKYRKYSPVDNTTTIVEYMSKSVKGDVDFAIIEDLTPYTLYEIKIELANSEGSIETGPYQAQTGEGVPGPVPKDSFEVTDTTETSISIKWEEPEIINGELIRYEVKFRGKTSHQPDFIPQLDYNLFQVKATEHNVTLDNLHPGTEYAIAISAQTSKGSGPVVEVAAFTKISAPKMEVPSPTPDDGSSSTPTTIEILIQPAEAYGAPISNYYIVIEEIPESAGTLQEAPGPFSDSSSKPKTRNGSRNGKKRKNKNRRRNKRQIVVPSGDSNSACHSTPITFEESKRQNKTFYFGGKLPPESVTEGTKFVVGEGSDSGGFTNPPLDPNKKYNIYVRVDSKIGNDTRVNCALVAIKASMPPTTPFSTTTTTSATPKIATVPNKNVENDGLDSTGNENKNPPDDIDNEEDSGSGSEELVKSGITLYASIGAGVAVLLIIIVIILVLITLRRKKNMKHKDEVVNPFEVRMMMTDVSATANGHSINRNPGTGDRQALMMPDVVDFENHDFMEKTLDASGTHTGTFRSGSTPLHEERPALRVDDFHIHVNDMKRQNNFGFHEEFTSFREGQTSSWEIGKRDENRAKNRYGNIMAYDHSRVVLQPVKGQDDQIESDYINANYVHGYKSPSMYIAAQAPSPETVDDFWLMIWQEKSPVVVMVTNVVELGKRKCHKYWPDESAQYGSIKVSQTHIEDLCDYTIRTFVIQQFDGYDVREVKQFHFTAWPDHGVPTRPTNILTFIRRVKSYETPGQGPTTVHCSAGSGRTGCFIVIDMMLDMAREEGVIDIYNTVTDLRSRRVNMVQTEEQYIFIHDSVLEALLCGDTLVAASDLRQHYDDLITVDQLTQIAPVQEEFETLNVMTPKLTDDECEVARLPRNRERNRFMDVLPSDRQMPYLVTPHPTDPDSNYINAIFTDSYAKRNAFIVTQTPLLNTVIDFWRLVYDYNCTSVIMMNDLGGNDTTCCQYWPDTGGAVYGTFSVELYQLEDEVDFTTRVLKLQNMNKPNEPYRLIKQFQLTNWPVTQPVPYTRNAVLRVIQLVNKWQIEGGHPDVANKKDEGRMLVHCLAGAGRSGTFVACYNMCMQLRQEYAVDVFNIVQRLRNVRPQLVETLEQYRFCYEVGWDFADQ